MSNAPFRWAVIGSGNIANRVFTEITKTGRHKAETVFSVDRRSSGLFAARFHAKHCNSVREAVEDKNVDGVYICTTNDAHYPLAAQAVRAEKPVLVESPLTINFAQIKELFAMAKENDVFVCQADWFRFTPIITTVRELVTSNALGRIQRIEASLSDSAPWDLNIRQAGRAEIGGGALMDAGSKLLSFAEMLMGYPVSIKCTARMSRAYETDSVMDAVLGFNGGASVELYSNRKKHLRSYAYIRGEFGTIRIPQLNNPRSAIVKLNGYRCRYKKTGGYIYQFDKVAADIKAGKLMSEEMTWANNMNVLRAMDGCRTKTGLRYPRALETTRVVFSGDK